VCRRDKKVTLIDAAYQERRDVSVEDRRPELGQWIEILESTICNDAEVMTRPFDLCLRTAGQLGCQRRLAGIFEAPNIERSRYFQLVSPSEISMAVPVTQQIVDRQAESVRS